MSITKYQVILMCSINALANMYTNKQKINMRLIFVAVFTKRFTQYAGMLKLYERFRN